jgi:hypothetical protein
MKKMILLMILLLPLAASGQYQLPNPGFEQWDGGTTSEPTHWNTFSTSDGTYSSLASSDHHYRRNGGRPGSTGSYYLTIYTKSILGIKANGNMTTGRIHAGSMTPSSSDNYNYTQRSNNHHCQPFSGTPDSLYVWVSYYAANDNSEAQVSAILHGDNDFRSPNQEDNPSLYCGKASARFHRTTTSASTMQWQQLRVPFVYDGESEGRYMLVNITSNAIPGEGDGDDSLSIDDIEFVYSSWLSSISVNGRPVDGFEKDMLDLTVHVDDPSILAECSVTGTPEVADATVSVETQQVNDSTLRATLTVIAESRVTSHRYRLTLTTGHPAGAHRLAADNPQRATHSLQLWPNPAEDAVTVDDSSFGPEPVNVTVTDAAGRPQLQLSDITLPCRLDLSKLPSGLYLLTLSSPTHRASRQLVVR